MGRPPCCEKIGVKKGPWTPEEDIILVSYIQEHGPGNWRSVPTNTVLIGLLQIIPTNAGVRIDTLRGFLVVFMIYFVLLVCEVKFRRNQALIYYCVGNFSHLFGVFAADMLVSLIFPIFALVIATLYLFWFFFVMYRSFAKNMPPKVDQSGTANPVDQLPPV
ncbi:hypothetical protein ARALYDRAFT_336488 [Arabidopsis lyrata subsp. lyrata]|uniref:Uncharacterized protein n=1 Tax=Arabidopsis lyrata subsp. lyrata TaxID=81972 RepID=D7KK40_ARALL|nr:hypothetical protein ARALYDRAFT_336488 [Arabidopsis lyrata subsp. lyrata]